MINKRLVWNFEWAPQITDFPSKLLREKKVEPVKWEIRFFWADDEIIRLNPIDNSLLELANYQRKHRQDYYYLLPNTNYNIKKRHDDLVYKPVVQTTTRALGYGAKINLNQLANNEPDEKKLHQITQDVLSHGQEIFIKKEAFIYKFPTTPTIKLELARLILSDTIYFSLCIEGKSLYLVEQMADYLLGKHVSCDYITFIKNNLPS